LRLSRQTLPKSGRISDSIRVMVCILVLLSLPCCTGDSERKARDEVLTSLSLQKLANFAKVYPDSVHTGPLVDEFLDRCETELDAPGCYQMVLDVLPKTSRWRSRVVNRLHNVK